MIPRDSTGVSNDMTLSRLSVICKSARTTLNDSARMINAVCVRCAHVNTSTQVRGRLLRAASERCSVDGGWVCVTVAVKIGGQ